MWGAPDAQEMGASYPHMALTGCPPSRPAAWDTLGHSMGSPSSGWSKGASSSRRCPVAHGSLPHSYVPRAFCSTVQLWLYLYPEDFVGSMDSLRSLRTFLLHTMPESGLTVQVESLLTGLENTDPTASPGKTFN
ncbi:Hypothetical predicted protein [Marmota monax]|uniref:Uncharacterized protein n=1 Tax=Marmota monax TaxID=9995 RepID=A0A5E4CU37_MARMO|nr:hypothetical protein GHT09_005894 [Marmota monax]VTJ84669.1 Hypothetical predicted protein [Marmota monax]